MYSRSQTSQEWSRVLNNTAYNLVNSDHYEELINDILVNRFILSEEIPPDIRGYYMQGAKLIVQYIQAMADAAENDTYGE